MYLCCTWFLPWAFGPDRKERLLETVREMPSQRTPPLSSLLSEQEGYILSERTLLQAWRRS